MFLCLLGFGTLGVFPALKLMQFMAKEDAECAIKKSLPERDLIRFCDLKDNKAVEWTGKEEFEMCGKLYDIVRTEQQNGHTIYYCFSDSNETQIVAQIEDIVKKQFAGEQSHKGLAAHHLLKLLVQVYIPIAHFRLNARIPNHLAEVPSSYIKAMKSDRFITVITPPPRFEPLV